MENQPTQTNKPTKSSKLKIILPVAIIVLILAIASYFIFFNKPTKSSKLKIILPVAIIVLILAIASYFIFFNKPTENAETELAGTLSSASNYQGKKVFYIDSYHRGYEWSDGIKTGIESTLPPEINLEIIEMDTKRNTEEDFKKAAALRVKEKIESFNPDVVIASDDNAFKYVVQEYYKDANLPFVFCGLNWDASLYDAPYTNTAGMVEVALTLQIIEDLKQYSKGEKIGYLSANVTTERKNLEFYDKLLDLTFDSVYLVTTIEEWKTQLPIIQDQVDILIIGNNAGINDWNKEQAALFAQQNTKIPTGAIYDWMMPYSLLGLTKSSRRTRGMECKSSITNT